MRDLSEDQLGVLKLKDARGAEIVNLDHDGPACKAGMRMHDVILQMNGQVIENEDQLRRMLRDMPVGRTISFLVSRDGQTQTMTMTTGGPQDGGAAGVGAALLGAGAGAFGSRAGRQTVFWIPSRRQPEAETATAQKEHRDLLGTETIILSSSFTGAKLEVMGPQLAEFFGATGRRGAAGAECGWKQSGGRGRDEGRRCCGEDQLDRGVQRDGLDQDGARQQGQAGAGGGVARQA